MPVPHVGVLGPLQVTLDGQTSAMDSPIRRALLAALVVSHGEFVTLDRLMDAVWGDQPPETAHRTLQSHVSRLRQALGSADAISADGRGYRLDLPADHIDSLQFERLVRSSVDATPAEAIGLLELALSLWRGPAFVEFADREFARPAAVRLEELRLDVTERRLRALVLTGSPGEAVAGLEALVSVAPLREGAWGVLAEALAVSGRSAEGLRALDRSRAHLAEIGLSPSNEMRDLAQRLVEGGAGPAQRETHDGDTLPHRPTSFVGRNDDVDRLVDLLREARIVTLTGPPGVGKSRLAVETGHVFAARTRYATALVELAPVSDDAVVAAMARDLGVTSPTTEGLAAGLRGRRLMVVIDNCDHVLDEVAPVVEQLAAACPTVRFVATSRERVGVDGEHLWPVHPLVNGDEQPIEGAVRLFMDRAAAIEPDFPSDAASMAQVATICRLLGGLPLAIEMAAAQVRALTVDDLVRLLPVQLRRSGGRRSDLRHETLMDTVRWSYRRLPESHRSVFDELSCFAGSFSADAVADVTGMDWSEVVVILGDLVEGSLLRLDRSTGRYDMLEVLRQIAAAWLGERGETHELAVAHARHFVAVAETLGPRLRGPEEPEAVAAVNLDLDNLRMAHRTAIARDDIDLLARLSSAFHYFSQMHVRSEILDWAVLSVAAHTAPGHPMWPTVYASAAAAAVSRGDLDDAVALARAGLDVGGSPAALAHCHEMLGEVALTRGDTREVAEETAAALNLVGTGAEDSPLIFTLINGCLAMQYGGDHEGALVAAAQIADLARRAGAPTLIGWSHYVNGEVSGDRDPQAAIAELESAVDLARTVRNEFLESVAAVSISSLQARHGDPTGSAAGFIDVVQRWRRLGDRTHQWTTLRNLVGLLVRLDHGEEAAVLLGGTTTASNPTFGEESERLQGVSVRLRETLGDQSYEAAIERGRAMPQAQVVDYALAALTDIVDAG